MATDKVSRLAKLNYKYNNTLRLYRRSTRLADAYYEKANKILKLINKIEQNK